MGKKELAEQVSIIAPKRLRLEKPVKEKLEKILAGQNTSQQVVKKARTIILASSAKNCREIARQWRDRWCSAFAHSGALLPP